MSMSDGCLGGPYCPECREERDRRFAAAEALVREEDREAILASLPHTD